jgi:hypothetical protein
MAGIGNSIYMRHPAPVEDNPSINTTINPSILTLTGYEPGFAQLSLENISYS